MTFIFERANLSKLDKSSLPIIDSFLTALADDYNGQHVQISYIVALQTVRLLVNLAVQQYQHLEGLGHCLQKEDKLKVQQQLVCQDSNQESNAMSFDEANKLLCSVLALEDQLWAMSQSPFVSSGVKNLWPQQTSRLHTAFGRMSSMVDVNDYSAAQKLADIGLVNVSDQLHKFEFFQEPTVPVENIYSASLENNLILALDRQFATNTLLKGQPTWNIPLEQTLNQLPPQVHRNFLPPAALQKDREKEYGNVDVIKTTQAATSFVMSGDLKAGSINIWSTGLGLQLAGGFNFKKQAWHEDSGDKDQEKLDIYKLKRMGDPKEGEAQLLLRETFFAMTDGPSHKEENAPSIDVTSTKTIVSSDKYSDEVLSLVDDTAYEHYDLDQEYAKTILSINEAFDTPKNLSPPKPALTVNDLLAKRKSKPQPLPKLPKPSPDDAKIKALAKNLTDMGFKEELAIKAVKGAKQLLLPDVLQQAALLQEEEKKKNPGMGPQKVKAYNCPTCTYLNKEGQSSCEMCSSPAPSTALESELPHEKVDIPLETVKEENSEESDSSQQKPTNPENSTQEPQKPEEMIDLQEERKRNEHAQVREEMLAYYRDSEITDYFFAAHKGGASRTPLFTGAIFQNRTNKRCDVHFLRFKYAQDYKSLIGNDYLTGGINSKDRKGSFTDILSCKQKTVESLYPSIIGTDQVSNVKPHPIFKQPLKPRMLRPSQIGTVCLEFERVEHVCQVGDDVRHDQPMYIIVVGHKQQGCAQTATLISLDHKSKIHVHENYQQLPVCVDNKEITGLSYSHATKSLLVTTGDVMSSCRVEIGRKGLTITRSESLSEVGQVVGESHGIVMTEKNRLIATMDALSGLGEEESCVGSGPVIQKEEVLKMQIDPDMVTLDDIEHYENLMQGSMAMAASNSNNKVGKIPQKNDEIFSKHTWTRDHFAELSTLEYQFEKPTTLISLSLDITFVCQDTAKLLNALDKQLPLNRQKEEESSQAEDPEFTSLIDTTSGQATKNYANLGRFSIDKNFDFDQAQIADKGQNEKDKFLPLQVKHWTGAVFQAEYDISSILFDDDSIYASNYAKPVIVFEHADGVRMSIDKVTIRTPLKPKSGAFPAGGGLIFLSDTLTSASQTSAFSKFNASDYSRWKAERVKDPRPLRSDEPVAFFSFEQESQISVELDCKRPGRYIILKPTSIRQKPTNFNQSVESTPIEIEFFGANGRVMNDNKVEFQSVKKAEQNLQVEDIHSGYELLVTLMGTDELVYKTESSLITQFSLTESTLSRETLLSAQLKGRYKLRGSSLIHITDSSLQLKKVRGIKVTIKPTAADWSFSSATIQAINPLGSGSEDRTLFRCPSIPTQYYRSCLMSPEFFPVVNRQIASIASQPTAATNLRMKVIRFLVTLVQTDPCFTPLIFHAIDLREFLQCNLLEADEQMMNQAADLLKCFQKLPEFCSSLFEILLQKVESLTQYIPNSSGYNAVMGMLKWVTPLDPQRSYQTILRLLYRDVVNEKIRPVQQEDVIEYRTRYAERQPDQDLYPFDSVLYQQDSAKSDQIESGANDTLSSDLIRTVQVSYNREAKDYVQGQFTSHEVDFFGEATLRSLHVFFQQPQFMVGFRQFCHCSYHTTINVWQGSNLVFKEHFGSHIYQRMAAHHTRAAQTTETDHQALVQNMLPLSLPLVVKCQKLRVDVKFEYASNTNCYSSHKIMCAPITLIEFFGNSSVQEAGPETNQEFLNAYREVKQIDRTVQIGSSVKYHQGEQMQLIPEQRSEGMQKALVGMKVGDKQLCPHCAQSCVRDEHRLKRNFITCEMCTKKCEKDALTCHTCDYDICQSCTSITKEFGGQLAACQVCKGSMKLDPKRMASNHISCSFCKQHCKNAPSCIPCDFDLCIVCHKNKIILQNSQKITAQSNPNYGACPHCSKPLEYDAARRLKTSIYCDQCGKNTYNSFVCKPCDYDVCTTCRKLTGYAGFFGTCPTCQKPLNWDEHRAKGGGVTCDVCKTKAVGSAVCCKPCDHDICGLCRQSKETDQCAAIKGQTDKTESLEAQTVQEEYVSQPQPISSNDESGEIIDTTSPVHPENKGPKQEQPKEFQEDLAGLILVQDELRGELQASNPAQQIYLVEEKAQQVMQKLSEAPEGAAHNRHSERSLKYLIHLATDFSKLLRYIQTLGKLSTAQLRDIFAQEHKELPSICLDFFRHLVAYESIQARRDGLSFIQHVIIPLMSPQEKSTFAFNVIENFLLQPVSHYSQLSIISGLNELDVSFSDLFTYLAMKIGVNGKVTKATQFIQDVINKNDMGYNPVVVISTVISLAQKGINQGRQEYQKAWPEVGNELTENLDNAFLVSFRCMEWVCRNEFDHFNKGDQVALLQMLLSVVKALAKVASPQLLSGLAQQTDALQACFLQFLCLHEKSNLTSFTKATSGMHLVTLKKAKNADQKQLKDALDDLDGVMAFKESLNKLYQQILQWLIQMELDPAAVKQVPAASELVNQCTSRAVWIQHFNVTIDSFIENSSTQRVLQETRDQLVQRANSETGQEEEKKSETTEDQNIITTATQQKDEPAAAVGLVKSLITIIEQISGKGRQSNFKYVSSIWGLALRSLRVVQVQEIEKIFDQLIQAFLNSSQEIRQTSYPQLLTISEKIAQETAHGGRFIVNLLQTTLGSNEIDEVGFAVCQGWLDIMINSTCTGNAKQTDKGSDKWTVYSALSPDQVQLLLKEATRFLLDHLNLGNFEGPSGANQLVVRRLTLAKSLLFVAWHACDNDKKPAISGLINQAERDENVRKGLKENFDGLLLWLLFNQRAEADELATQGYAAFGHKSPATVQVKDISELIMPLLTFVSDSDENTQALKIALRSLMDLVQAMNTGVLKQLQSQNMGLQVSHRLSTRTNAIFQNLLQKWLVTESAVRYFVFELNGFDFLLETIGTNVENLSANDQGEEFKSDQMKRDQSSVGQTIAGSDLLKLFGRDMEQNIISATSGAKADSLQRVNELMKNARKMPAPLPYALAGPPKAPFSQYIHSNKKPMKQPMKPLPPSYYGGLHAPIEKYGAIPKPAGPPPSFQMSSFYGSQQEMTPPGPAPKPPGPGNHFPNPLLQSQQNSNLFMDFGSPNADFGDFGGPKLLKKPSIAEKLARPMKTDSEQVDDFDERNIILEEFAKTMDLVQESFENNPKSVPKQDWSVNKCAYKSRVFQKFYKDSDCFEHSVTFKLSAPAELREIQIGCVNYWQSEHEVYVEPMSVLVQAGMDMDNLVNVCNLDPVTDHAFSSSSVQVFGKNLRQFSSQKEDGANVQDKLFRMLDSIFNFRCQYLKFSFRRNTLSCLENSPLANRLNKRQCFGINYVSLSGVDLSKAGEGISGVSKFILKQQQKCALEIMSLVCSGGFSPVLKIIANQGETIDKIKKLFELVSQFIGVKNNAVEPTLIGLSTHNAEMGDWILARLVDELDIVRYASLIGKLVVCDASVVANRLSMLFSNIITSLQEGDKALKNKSIERILPLIDIYVRSLQLVGPELMKRGGESVALQVEPGVLMDIIQLLTSATEERARQSMRLQQFIIAILCPPEPFYNAQIDQVDFAETVLLQLTADISPNMFSQMQQLAGALASQSSKLSSLILQQRVMFDTLMSGAGEEAVRFWLNVAHDAGVRKQLQEEELPRRLYMMIREEDPQKAKRVIKNTQKRHTELVVQLIMLVSAGHPQSEKFLSEKIIDDIQYLEQSRDEFFINRILLPFIKNEQCLPVSFVQVPDEERDWQPNADLLTTDGAAGAPPKSKRVEENTSLAPSSLFDARLRGFFLQAVKEKVGKNSKSTLENIMGVKWECAHTQTKVSQEISGFQPFWERIAGNSPAVMICTGKFGSVKTTLGAYVSATIPPYTSAADQTLTVKPQPEDFCFLHQDGQGTYFLKPYLGAGDSFILEMLTDYEGGGAISLAQDFLMISWGHEFSFHAGAKDCLEEMKIDDIPQPTTNWQDLRLSGFTLEKFELWVTSNQQVAGAADASSLNLQQRVNQSVSMITPQSQRHPWVVSANPCSLFRTRPVYMAPSHLQITQLAKIMLGRSISLVAPKCRHIEEKLSGQTLGEVYAAFMADSIQSERQNNILDLGFSINSLNSAAVEDTQPTMAVDFADGEHFAATISSMYKPNNGFFDQFEEQGGVSKFISVTLATLKLWKNQALAEKWAVWLKELQSFSEIPLYFQIFMKNEKCKDLLFKILGGLPDQQTELASKWEDEQKEAVQFNYEVLSQAFTVSNDVKLRDHAVKAGFLQRILERLASISGEKSREFQEEEVNEEEEGPEPVKLERKKSYTKNTEKKKRHGVGFSATQGVTFNVVEFLENKKQRSEQIKTLVEIVTGFLSSNEWRAGTEVLDDLLESAMLPMLENAYRNGSWLDMSKDAEVFHAYFDLTKAIAGHEELLPALLDLDKRYRPVQKDPIYKLLASLNDLATIFTNCLNQSQKESLDSGEYSQVSQKLVVDVKKTHETVQNAISESLANQNDDDFIQDALSMPVPEQYRTLCAPMRFDYMDVTKHHYQNLAKSNQSPPPAKMVRLAQELADISNALPSEHTNAVFVRVDKNRVDMMKAMLSGAIGTPYAHGLYEYDIFFDNGYPGGPPKMNLTTTGNGQIRFNPNLYACGKVCLSLLGTWRGNATENWDPKISTALQVLLSVQAIIMSEEVYFNEPGFEGEAGTPEGERKNEGYMNVVRYGNVKWAMLGHLKSPPAGFESVVKRHFYIKRAEILQDVHAWLELGKQNEASYAGLVGDHNRNICAEFRKSTGRYVEMLAETVKELEECINKLEQPANYAIKPAQGKKKVVKKKNQAITEGAAEFEGVDMGTDSEDEQINTSDQSARKGAKDIDIEDEAVKDRWSRYIGAMGLEAVAKQANAGIFLSGANALGIEIAKNIVLAGCKKFTLHDTKPISSTDLSGQFFLTAGDQKKHKTRSEACISRLQQLNNYVPCKVIPGAPPVPRDMAEMEKDPWNFNEKDVIILIESDYQTIIAVNDYCKAKNKKFIACDTYGVFGRVFNDFGEFEVLDKNGESLLDVNVKHISNDEKGLVELLPTVKHKLEDGDEVLFAQVDGMKLLEGQQHDDPEVKSDNINDTIHKVTVVNPYAFKIGDTRKYGPYEGNGIAKQLRTKLKMEFKSFRDTMMGDTSTLPQDANLAYADFEKMSNNQLAHVAFEALDKFKQTKEGAIPKAWHLADAAEFVELAKPIAVRYDQNPSEWKKDGHELSFFYKFAFTCSGVFNPLCAFFGGFVAQEIVKAITQKFSPTNQLFYYDASEVLPEFSLEKHVEPDGDKEFFEKEYIQKIVKGREIGHRSDGLRICIGEDLVQKLAQCRLFMAGAGAIGCELLKNYAMCGVATAEASAGRPAGSIVLTDPDIIEVSNLNRQFLFREKHLRKPKSQTAAAAAVHMNPELHGHVIPRLDLVHEGTSHIFTDQFFEGLDAVTNALDNVKARLYIDARCVTAQTALLESGTLGPKGHVQVILPGQTESYGSMADPEDNTEIPHCTLKMFPEETLHCVEWARDKFSKLFTQAPKSAIKVLEEGNNINPVSQQDIVSLKEGLKLLRKRPENFSACIEFARLRFEKLFNHDIRQLRHVYPLDAKTKEGAPFWSLPKRPPTPVDFDKNDLLHCAFVTSLACLFANVFFVEIPHQTPRSADFKKHCGEMASQFKVPEFKPDEQKAKEIQSSVSKADNKEKEEEEPEEESSPDPDDTNKLKQEFLHLYKTLNIQGKKSLDEYLVKAEEFEKDNDANFHIDFMYSMGNCRATNYKLDPMDWITVKLKAGRIVPALATTTACVAGLQTLELVKILKQAKKEDHRNIFLNLAVPFMQASEPGDVTKCKLTEGLEVTLWDRWQLDGTTTTTLQQVVTHIETTYKGLEVRDVLQGNTPIYFHALMSAAGKEKERKKVLEASVYEVTDCDQDDRYVDLNVTCVLKDDPEGKILSGVPPVRIIFKKA